jgi:hypothetical protein
MGPPIGPVKIRLCLGPALWARVAAQAGPALITIDRDSGRQSCLAHLEFYNFTRLCLLRPAQAASEDHRSKTQSASKICFGAPMVSTMANARLRIRISPLLNFRHVRVFCK